MQQHLKSLLVVHADVEALIERWHPGFGSEATSAWQQVGAVARWLLDLPALERVQRLDEVGSPSLQKALEDTLVIFQHVTSSEASSAASEPAPPTEAQSNGQSIIGTTIGPYEVLDRIGEGGMGVVYRARDQRLGRTVALKFLPHHLQEDAAARTRFEHEARAASSLDHPNVGYIHEIAETEEGRLFIAMAYYPGQTLHDALEDGPLPLDEALRCIEQVAQGLQSAHASGIIHRDIKPGNVIITPGGTAKVLDFGLAKTQDVTLTRANAKLGTVAYMSPEQVRGDRVDARADIWALGALLYELVTGARAFQGEYETAVMYSVLNDRPIPIHEHRADAPETLQAIIDRCLEKDPDDRYPDAAAFLADLQRHQEGAVERVSSSYGAVSGDIPPRSRRALGVAFGLILLASLLWFAVGRVFPGNAAIQSRHLAVLPFQVIGAAADADMYAAGLLESLTSKITQLEQFQGALWVVPASEIDEPMTPTDAQKRFGVSMVVSGSIQLADEQIRLTLNLIDAKTRRQIRSEQIDQRRAGALSLQDEAILMVARMLRVELQPEERAALTAGGTTAPDANDFYLRGRGYLRNQQSVGDIDLAIRLFQQAIGRDSLFALAHAGLGEAYWQKYRATEEVQWADLAEQSSQEALALNAKLAPVYVTLGLIRQGQGQYAEALEAFQQALEIDPFNADAYRRRARVYRSQGAFDQAEAAYKKAIELKPGYWRGYNSLGALYYITGRYEAAIEQFERAAELAPENKSLLINMGAANWQVGRLKAATDAFERILSVDPEHTTAQENLATAYFYQGQFDRAAALYEAQLDRNPADYSVQGFLADAYYWMGERAQARTAYRRAIRLVRDHFAVRADDPDLLSSLASFHARLGESDSAAVYLDRVEAVVDPAQSDVVLAFGVGEVYVHIDRRADGLRWMERALRSGYGWIQVDHSPWLADFRADSSVQAWLASIRSVPD